MTSSGARSGPPFDLLSAYRAELARRPSRDAISADDGEWLSIGTLFVRAAALRPTRSKAFLRLAGSQLRTLLGEARWMAGPPIDPAPPKSMMEIAPRVRILCEDIEDAGAIGVADALAQAYLGSGDTIPELEAGRFDALRARFAWKRGDHAGADDLYERVAARGKRIRSPELMARAEIGRAILARLRGNYPETRAASERAVAIADDHGFTRIGVLAHHLLMAAAATMNDYNTALHHGWRAYQGVRGDLTAESIQLADLGRLFSESGHPEHAEAAFTAALQHPLPKRALLPTLGAAALAAAQRGDRASVLSHANRVLSEGDAGAVPYATATSLLDIAHALAVVNEPHAAERARLAALGLARDNRYHEIEYRAEHLSTAPHAPDARALQLSEESAVIGGAIRELAGSAI